MAVKPHLKCLDQKFFKTRSKKIRHTFVASVAQNDIHLI